MLHRCFRVLFFYVVAITAIEVAKPAFLLDTRIIGGSEVDISKHPYLASIRVRSKAEEPYWHLCAGSVYTNRSVITAAQCVVNVGNNERITVVLGANTRTGSDGMQYPVKKWIAHPDFSHQTADYDVAILILEEPINSAQRSIRIKENRPTVGKLGTIAGWGYREQFGPSSYRLEETQVPIVSTADCIKAYGAGDVTARMICAGDMRGGGKDACQGDTGGPLVVENELVGLVSWGRGCGLIGYPTVYSYALSYKDWIDNTVSANV